MKRIKEVDILKADENSIVVMHVDVAGLPGIDADHYLKTMSRKIEPIFKKKKINFIIIPFRGEKYITFEVIKKDEYAKIRKQ
jgi:CRISPR/Cas system-associated endoribonuclease Cas2